MKYCTNFFLVYSIIICFISCNDDIKVICKFPNNYFLIKDRDYNSTSINYLTENGLYADVISEQVTSVVNDSDWILVKQIPMDLNTGKTRRDTNYYIIPLRNKISKFLDLNKIGPLNEKQLIEKSTSLGISDSLCSKLKTAIVE